MTVQADTRTRWDQRWVNVHLNADGRPVENQLAHLRQLMVQGWEPYAVTPASNFSYTHWLRRSTED